MSRSRWRDIKTERKLKKRLVVYLLEFTSDSSNFGYDREVIKMFYHLKQFSNNKFFLGLLRN